jgi:hypothetical protein
MAMLEFKWIVPVIVVIVWVINAILKSRENEEPVRPKRPGGGPREGRNPVGDIDRFLQEIDRLRQKTAEERGTAVPPPVVRAVARARPVPAPAPARPRPVARPALVLEPLPVVQAISPAMPIVQPAAPAGRLGDTARTLVPSMAGRVAASYSVDLPRVNEALNLLRSRHSATTALVLKEILGPPKCRQ